MNTQAQQPTGQQQPSASQPAPESTPQSAPARAPGGGSTPLPTVRVESKRPRKTTPGPPRPTQTAASQARPTTTTSTADASDLPPLQQAPQLGKTGTKLEDLPVSVHIVPHETFTQQGDTMLRQAITNSPGVNEGGQDSLGYFDHFLIRGLNAQIYSDSFSDGDQLGGVSHSLNGVQRIEILEGPGSALFGSGPPGGTINIVHYQPSPVFHYGASLMFGSFGTVTNNDFVTGPTTIPGLNYRLDATFSHADGFRSLDSHDYEIRPDFLWTVNNHKFELTLDARDLHRTPDSYGLIYFHGQPITGVPIDAKYSTRLPTPTSSSSARPFRTSGSSATCSRSTTVFPTRIAISRCCATATAQAPW